MASSNANVFVAVRTRPKLEDVINAAQTAERYCPECIAKANENTVVVSESKGRESKHHSFAYDCVFDKDSTQKEIYEDCVQEGIDAALTYNANVTIITYGQTGSGKTFTVLGNLKNNPLSDDVMTSDTGLFLRALKDLLSYAEAQESKLHVVLCLSIVEIYLDTVRDLLSPTTQTLKLVVDNENVQLPDLIIRPITCLRDAIDAYKVANSKRVSRATEANDQSSRSHALFMIEIFQQERIPNVNPDPPSVDFLQSLKERQIMASNKKLVAPKTSSEDTGAAATTLKVPNEPSVMYSKVVLSDLAGSEKLKHSKAQGDVLEETKKINMSLTLLGNVVHSLYTGGRPSYRDSKLTLILRQSFTARNNRIIFIANVAPTQLTVEETFSTLRFADKVKELHAAGSAGINFNAELEYYARLRTCEELSADVRVANVTGNGGAELRVLPLLRRCRPCDGKLFSAMLAAPLFVGSSSSAKTIKAKDAEVQRLSAQLADEVKKNAAARKDAAMEEHDAMTKSVVDDIVGDHSKRVEILQKHLSQIEREVAQEYTDTDKLVSAAQKEVDSMEVELDKLAVESDELLRGKKRLGRTLPEAEKKVQALDAQIQELERKYMAVFAKNEDKWSADKASWEKNDNAEAVKARVYESVIYHLKSMEVVLEKRQEMLELQRELAASARQWRHIELYDLMIPIVLEMVDSSLLLAHKRRLQRMAAMSGPGKRRPRPKDVAVAEDDTARSETATAGAHDQLASLPHSRPPPKSNRPTSSATEGARSPQSSPSSATSSADVDNRHGSSPPPRTRPPAKASRPQQQVTAAVRERVATSLYDNPNLVNEILIYLESGTLLIKHGRSGKPHTRFFYLYQGPEEDAPILLCWNDSEGEIRDGSSGITTDNIENIVLGQYTEVFRRHEAQELEFYLSLSIVYIHKQQRRTLDVVCETDAELEAWVIGLCFLCKLSPRYGAPMDIPEDDEYARGFGMQALELCSTWHIRPKLLRVLHQRITDFARRRRVHVPTMSPGDLRFVTQIDIFRASAVWEYLVARRLVRPPPDGIVRSYLAYGDPTSPEPESKAKELSESMSAARHGPPSNGAQHHVDPTSS